LTLCTFWYVGTLARAGRLEEARLVFEKMFTYANHLGLYSEEIGSTGEQLGNFPQAFSHLALISAAINLNTGEQLGTFPQASSQLELVSAAINLNRQLTTASA
jgi:GH15 family glucan-1,4-alpha-glucosidase